MDSTTASILGVVIGAVLSFSSTLIVSRGKRKSGFKAIKVDVLQRKIVKLEESFAKLSNVVIEIESGPIPDWKMMEHGMLLFSQRLNATKNIHYLLPKSHIDEIKDIDAKIGSLIFNAKTGRQNNPDEIQDIFRKVQTQASAHPNFILEELRRSQIILERELHII